ncbi:MAG: DUF4380 domain-containing protein [Planctomycetes bacterium]|nr:DUF4380 domain-containing protein [Planctomycetota bacterium]
MHHSPALRSAQAVLLAACLGGAWAADAPTVRKGDFKGWSAYLLGNGLVTLGLAPEAGGRAVRFDLGAHPLLWLDPQQLGRSFAPVDDGAWHDFGGDVAWLAPHSRWRRDLGLGPPQPELDHGAWTAQIEAGDESSAIVTMHSPVAGLPGWSAVGIQLQRRFTLFRNQAHVRVEQTMTNTAAAPAVWALWEDVRVPGAHEGLDDWEKHAIYFPLRTDSVFGQRGFRTFHEYGDDEGQWRPIADEGVVQVLYRHRAARLGADSDGGWICSVDERDGYAFALRYALAPEPAVHPDGITVAVSTSATSASLTMGVLGPLVALEPQASATLVVDWYATRSDGPVLAVGEAGLIKRRLEARSDDKLVHLTGSYGVFTEGTLAVVGLGDGDQPKRTSLGSYFVSPTQPVRLEADLKVPAAVTSVVLEVLDGDGHLVGILDRATVQRGH